MVVRKRYYINTLKLEVSMAKTYEHNRLRFVIVVFSDHTHLLFLMRRLSLIGIDAICQLSLGCLLMRTTASYLRYTGYLNFINGPISRVVLLIEVHVQLLSSIFF